jgi:CheY-like chemotaxis protein
MKSEKKLVVLVDDNSINLNAGKDVLAKKYLVVTAASAKKLLSILDKIDPALILLDVDMPEMNGFEAIEILKAKPETRDIPVIFLTGRAAEKDKTMGLSLGAADYIVKPFEPSMLLEKVESALGG